MQSAGETHKITLTNEDVRFLMSFVTVYAGQGCNVSTPTGPALCRGALQAAELVARIKRQAEADSAGQAATTPTRKAR